MSRSAIAEAIERMAKWWGRKRSGALKGAHVTELMPHR